MGAFWVERQAFGIYLYQYVFFDSRYYEHVIIMNQWIRNTWTLCEARSLAIG